MFWVKEEREKLGGGCATWAAMPFCTFETRLVGLQDCPNMDRDGRTALRSIGTARKAVKVAKHWAGAAQ